MAQARPDEGFGKRADMSKPDFLDDTADTTPGTTPPATPATTTAATSGVTPAATPTPAAPQPPQATTGGDVAARHDSLPCCSADFSLADVAQLLLSTGQAAVMIMTQEGQSLGSITERDILRSYLQGAPKDCKVGEWLQHCKAGQPAAATASSAASPLARAAPIPSRPSYQGAAEPEEPLRDALPRLLQPPSGGYLVAPDSSGRGRVLSDLGLARAAQVAQEIQSAQEEEELTLELLEELRAAQELEAALAASVAAATVAQFMEPLSEVPLFAPDSTMQQLLQALLSSPAHTALVADEQGVHGLATAEDALWAFHNQVCPSSLNAWQRLAVRPGRLGLDRRSIPADAPMQSAAEAMLEEALGGQLRRHLVAVRPGGTEVVGVLSPHHLASCARGASESRQRYVARQRSSLPQPPSAFPPHPSTTGWQPSLPPHEPAMPVYQPAMPGHPHTIPVHEPAMPVHYSVTFAQASLPGEQLPAPLQQTPVPVPQTSTPLLPMHQPSASSQEPSKPEQDISAPSQQPSMPGEPKPHRRIPVLADVMPRPVTVADLVAQRETTICSEYDTLAMVCQSLVVTGRTAAVVMDIESGVVRGVLTENDALQAFVEHAPWDLTIGDWLRGGEARAPGFMVPALTLPPNATVAEAAACMEYMAQEGTFSCHHLLVRTGPAGPAKPDAEGKTERQYRLLSVLDVAHGLIDAAAAEAAQQKSGSASAAAALSVKDVMKPRNCVPICTLSDNLREAFQVLILARQNCAVVVTEDASSLEPLEPKESKEQEGGNLKTAEDKLEEKDGGSEEEILFGELRQEEFEEQLEDRALEEEVKHSAAKSRSTICGTITTADVLRAYSDRLVGAGPALADWLPGSRGSPAKRVVSVQASVRVAAAVMAKTGMHHLLVVEPESLDIVGVVSALDISCAIGRLFMASSGFPPAGLNL
ncbi:unnamed protein product [Polarella glacialis]|uniref:CBS domain-containing protein n=1 Tax=Polarella glacialis TaxID=89957 RepID=A0A813IDC1_POLGL|nr:unnamed protein product [Polarella glacialis]